MSETGDNSTIAARREKLAGLRATSAAYPNDFQRDRKPARWRAYADQSREKLQENPPPEKAAGRIALRRDQGKAIFVTLQDGDERIQLYLRADSLGAESFARCKEWDLGDIVCARGAVFKTRVGELSLRADEARLLAKALRPPPEKFHGLADVEERFRRPYLALMSDENARAVLRKRGGILRALRDQLGGGRLPRSGNADFAAHPRRRGGEAVFHPSSRFVARFVFARRPRVAFEAPARRRLRARVRNRAQFSKRRNLAAPQSGIHNARIQRRLLRPRRDDRRHRAADSRRRPRRLRRRQCASPATAKKSIFRSRSRA